MVGRGSGPSQQPTAFGKFLLHVSFPSPESGCLALSLFAVEENLNSQCEIESWLVWVWDGFVICTWGGALICVNCVCVNSVHFQCAYNYILCGLFGSLIMV